MKREDVTKQFPDATPEQIKALLDINSNDIESFKTATEKAQGERDTLQTQIGTLNTEMQALKDSNATAEDYKAKFETLTADVEKQKQEAAAAQADADLTNAIKAAFGGKKFTSTYVESGLVADMKKAIELPENKGKGYAELFEGLTKDKEGIFAAEHAQGTMSGFGNTANFNAKDDVMRRAMGLGAKKE